MGYTVNTADGEMVYGSLEQLKEAYRFRLVTPDDLVREDETGKVQLVKRLLNAELPPAATAERPRDEQLGHPRWSLAAMAALTLLLCYLELRRLTVDFPALLEVPFLIHLLPGATPGGALPFVSELPTWLQPPPWFGLAHVGAGLLVLLIAARGWWAAPVLSALFLIATSTYLAATGRFGLAALVGAAALVPVVGHTRRVMRRLGTRKRRRGPVSPPALQRVASR